ncbi:MAG: sigma factor-like helix-turn-helix DNA-binding protein, partial [Chloroflexota bacterium]
VGDVDMMLSSFDPQLESALAQLQDDVREMLYLSAVEGYSVTELAELTQRPRGTILSLLHRTKKSLRALLSDPISNRPDKPDSSSRTGGVRQ